MAQIEVKNTPRLVAMIDSKISVDRGTLSLLFAAVDGRHFAIELEPQLVGPMVATMSAHSNALQATLPKGEELPTQALDVKDFRVAMNPAGHLGWQIELTNGVSMVLQFSPDQFLALDAKMSEVRLLVGRTVQ